MRREISKRLLNEAVEWYLSNFPDKHRVRRVGLEKEYLVVDVQTYEAADSRQLFGPLQNLGWQPVFDDFYKQELVGVKKDGVEITTDGGWCTLEISMPPEESIMIAVQKIREVEQLVSQLCQKQNILLLGYGIQPITPSHSRLWTKKRRYEILREALPKSVNNVTITAADQVHIDITCDEIVDAINVFNALTGPIINLFANSPFWKGKLDERGRLAVREDTDTWSFAGKKAGMPRRFANLEDLISEMFFLRFTVAKSEKDYFVPRVSFAKWASNNYDWRNHWKLHEGSIWWDSRARTVYGTIEIRQACSNKDNGCLSALVLGLVENLDQARALVEELPWEEWRILKSCAIYGDLNDNTLQKTTERMLQISEGGLKKRDNESIFLEPLWERLNSLNNPAKEAIKILENAGLEAFVRNCAIKID